MTEVEFFLDTYRAQEMDHITSMIFEVKENTLLKEVRQQMVDLWRSVDYSLIFEKFGVNELTIQLCADIATEKINDHIEYLVLKNISAK